MTTPLHAACYGDLKAWFRRRRRTIAIAAGALGAGCLLYYGIRRYRSSSAGDSPRVRSAQEDVHEERALQLKHHFDAIQLIADSTTLPASLQHFKASLGDVVNLSELTQRLMVGKEGPQSLTHSEKLVLWQKLKISSFTRALCAAWGMALVHLFVRVQLNLLGRHMYISTAMPDAKGTGLLQDLPKTAEHKFLAFVDYFPYHGLLQLVQDTEDVVEGVLRDVSLKRPYSYDELQELFGTVRANFERQDRDWTRYLLPEDDRLPEDLEASSSAVQESLELSFPESDEAASSSQGHASKYEELLSQLRIVLSSDEFKDVLSVSVDSLLQLMMQGLLPHYQGQPAVAIPLAKLVPAVSSLANQMLDSFEDSQYIRAVASLPQLNRFCTMVYAE